MASEIKIPSQDNLVRLSRALVEGIRSEIPTKVSELENDNNFVKNTDYATTTAAGIVSVVDQTFKGTKRFNSGIIIPRTYTIANDNKTAQIFFGVVNGVALISGSNTLSVEDGAVQVNGSNILVEEDVVQINSTGSYNITAEWGKTYATKSIGSFGVTLPSTAPPAANKNITIQFTLASGGIFSLNSNGKTIKWANGTALTFEGGNSYELNIGWDYAYKCFNAVGTKFA